MAKKTSARIGLYVTDKRDGNYYHIIATIVTIGLTQYEMREIDATPTYRPDVNSTTIRNVSNDYGHLHNGLYLQNLHVYSQGNSDDQARRLYAFAVRYQDVFSIEQREAEHMAHTLKNITSRMDKVYKQYGNPATFGAYLARVAQAIGADAFVVPGKHQRGWSYSENEQRIMTIADGIYHVDHKVDTWVNEREQKDIQS